MHFETVFDVAQAGYKDWWVPAIGLIFVAIGAALAFFPRWASLVISAPPWAGWPLIIFALIWMLGAFTLSYFPYIWAREALLSGDHSVVEGPVTDFVPMPRDGKGKESFTVAGQKFEYSPYGGTPGFNNASSHGGPLNSGTYVRVTHIGNTILRLEIAR